MSDSQRYNAATGAPVRRKRAGGMDGRRALRANRRDPQMPAILRKIPTVEIMDEEGLALIETTADMILQEIGIEFREDPEALQMWRQRACTDYRYQCGNAPRFGQDDPGSGPQLPGR